MLFLMFFSTAAIIWYALETSHLHFNVNLFMQMSLEGSAGTVTLQ